MANAERFVQEAHHSLVDAGFRDTIQPVLERIYPRNNWRGHMLHVRFAVSSENSLLAVHPNRAPHRTRKPWFVEDFKGSPKYLWYRGSFIDLDPQQEQTLYDLNQRVLSEGHSHEEILNVLKAPTTIFSFPRR